MIATPLALPIKDSDPKCHLLPTLALTLSFALVEDALPLMVLPLELQEAVMVLLMMLVLLLLALIADVNLSVKERPTSSSCLGMAAADVSLFLSQRSHRGRPLVRGDRCVHSRPLMCVHHRRAVFCLFGRLRYFDGR